MMFSNFWADRKNEQKESIKLMPYANAKTRKKTKQYQYLNSTSTAIK